MTALDSPTSTPHPTPASAPRTRARRRAPLTAQGEPAVWLTGGCIATAVLMIALLLIFITWQGLTTFWPAPLVSLQTTDGRTIVGEPTREDVYRRASGGSEHRTLYKVGNYDVTGEDFTWVD